MFKFIDLFAGIGGFRLALERLGGTCVFSSEINPHACEMYKANHGEDPFCDITKLSPITVPDFDILCAGFPCQAFSIAGKKLGFEETRGTLFFDICRILKEKKPKVVFLENVKNLKNHDNGNTLKVIISLLQELGYNVDYRILNARNFGIPQNRERIIIVASIGHKFNFEKVLLTPPNTSLNDILEDNSDYISENQYTLIPTTNKKESSGLIFSGYMNKTIRKGVKPDSLHLSRVHRQPNRIYSSSGCHPTLSSQESGGRYYILLDNKKVRKLTLNECYKLMGFPSNFKLLGSKNNLYARVGNSVCVPMIEAVGEQIKNQFFNN